MNFDNPTAYAKGELSAQLDASLDIPSQQAAINALKVEGERAALKLAADFGIPIPSNITPGTVAAYVMGELGIPMLPDLSFESILGLVAKETGLPIPVPLPESLKELAEMGLKLAAQYFGPQVLALIGAGSVIPGLGTVGGALAAFTIMFIETFGEGAGIPERAYECSRPFLQRSLTPIEVMGQSQQVLRVAIRSKELGGKYTHNLLPGSLDDCLISNMQAIQKLAPIVYGSAAGMTLPEVDAAILLFTETPKKLGPTGFAMPEALSVPLMDVSLWVLYELRARRERLVSIGDSFKSLATLDLGRAMLLKRSLAEEVGICAASVMRTSTVTVRVPDYEKMNSRQSKAARAGGKPFKTRSETIYYRHRKANLAQLQLALAASVAVDKHIKALADVYAKKTGAKGVQDTAKQVAQWMADETQTPIKSPLPATSPFAMSKFQISAKRGASFAPAKAKWSAVGLPAPSVPIVPNPALLPMPKPTFVQVLVGSMVPRYLRHRASVRAVSRS